MKRLSLSLPWALPWALPRALALTVLLGWSSAPLLAAAQDPGWEAYQAGDFQAAFNHWKSAAEAGEARAQFNLGTLYDDGRGVERDLSAAMAWWEKADDETLMGS